MKRLLTAISGCLVCCACSSAVVDHEVVSPAAETVVIETKGGLGPPQPPGATCEPDRGSFVVSASGRELAWEKCDGGTMRAGRRSLRPGEAMALEKALAGLAVVRNRDLGCGTASEWAPEVRVTVGARRYADEAHACKPDGPVLDPRTLRELHDVLVGLAHP